MTTAAAGRRRQGPGRLDPTVRGLLRSFLSPAVADRYASALQPIAVADRDAAIAGAVTTLRARFFVLPEEIAAVLVVDAGWSVADVSTMLGLPVPDVRAALLAARSAAPRVRATPPADLDGLGDEAAAVEAMLRGLPRHRRDAEAAAAAATSDDSPVDVDLRSTVPEHVARPDREAASGRADRLRRLVVPGAIVGVLALVAVTVLVLNGPDPAPPTEAADTVVATPSPQPTPQPTATASTSPDPTGGDGAGVPVGAPVLEAARFVASVDPATGAPGRTLDPATTDDDPRLWLSFSQLPAEDPLVTLTFTAPSGRSSIRPVLLSERTPLASVRLPDELGRAPGRYAVRIESDGMTASVVELQLVPDEE